MGALPVAHFPHAHIGVVGRQVRAGGEGEAEQPPRGVERRLDHVVEREIGLHLGLVEIVAGAADLLGVVAPVPRLDRFVEPLGAGHLLERRALGARLLLGRLPHLQQQALDRGGGLGHRIVEPVGGEIVVAEKPGLLGAQRHDLANERRVVGRARMGPARGPGLVCRAAQIAARGEGQKRLDRGARQGHDIPTPAARAPRRPAPPAARAKPGSPSRSASSSTSRHSRSSCSTFWPNKVCNVASRSLERRHAGLLLGAEQRAGAHQAQMVALEQAQLILGQAELAAPGMEIGHCARRGPGRVRCASGAGRALARNRGRSLPVPGWCRWHRGCKRPGSPDRAAARCVRALRSCRQSRPGTGAATIAAISASCSSMPRSKAGGKCSGRIRSNGGMPNGVSQTSEKRVVGHHRSFVGSPLAPRRSASAADTAQFSRILDDIKQWKPQSTVLV